MGLITDAFLMISGACAVLGVIGVSIWINQRKRVDCLAFSVVCLAVAVYALIELGMARATSPDEYLRLIRWSHLAAGPAIIGVAVFVWLYLDGRRWLCWLVIGLRLATIATNFLVFPNGINFLEIKSLGHVPLFGESVAYPIGVPNPWMALSHFAHLLLIVTCLDACFLAWRRGNRQGAIVFGTTTALFAVTSLGSAIGVLWGFVAMPMLATPAILFLIAGMVAELNFRMQQSLQLADRLADRETELREKLEELDLSVSAARVGLWTRNLDTGEVWVSDIHRQNYGLPLTGAIFIEQINDSIHPDDLERVRTLRREAEAKGGGYQVEHRVLHPDGQIRWMFSRGKVDTNGGTTRIMRGASVDITKQKAAEETIHELSGKLINAQEEERGRIARELHDDLSQRVALTSILLEEVRGSTETSGFVRNKVGDIIAQILTLATDMHRLSHELHPAKIEQLGLVPALRSFCHDIEAAYPVKIAFEAQSVPNHLPADVALCFYRVAQEAIQNVTRHSGASSAKVKLSFDAGELVLAVTDNGRGFDLDEVKGRNSLGLISIDERMRSVSGEASIHSSLGNGTSIEVRVPISDGHMM